MPRDDGFDRDTPEERVAALVDQVKQDPRARDHLVELLPERISLYAGRSTNAVVRMRGYVIAAFGQVGLPEAAMPYVLEELESGRDAYLVAAAARALRGLDRPTAQVVPFLLTAIENIKHADDALSFDRYRPRWPVPVWTTAIEEIVTTFAWLGEHASSALPRLEALADEPAAISPPARATLQVLLDGHTGADCCAVPLDGHLPAGLGHTAGHGRSAAVPTDVALEDQNGQRLTFGEFFRGQPSIVVFFYTRCDNPSKCSLTITKLARLQFALRQQQLQGQVRTAAITYDPDFDRPPRLRSYGENRGVAFGDNDRFLRTTAGLAPLRDYFELGVNFGEALVNRHRIELFVLDRDARITTTFARLQWPVQQVLDQVVAAARPSPGTATPDEGSPAASAAARRPGGRW